MRNINIFIEGNVVKVFDAETGEPVHSITKMRVDFTPGLPPLAVYEQTAVVVAMTGDVPAQIKSS